MVNLSLNYRQLSISTKLLRSYSNNKHVTTESQYGIFKSTHVNSYNIVNMSHSTLKRTKRSEDVFLISSHCLVCGKCNKYVNRKLVALTHICTGTGESIRQNVLKAAVRRQDEEVQQRMVFYTDLFAKDAKYHRSCYSAYVSERNVQAMEQKIHQDVPDRSADTDSIHQEAINALIHHMDNTIFAQESHITTLSALLAIYNSNSNEENVYKSWKLKGRLEQHYNNTIRFIPRPGQSDLVCSNNIDLDDILIMVFELKTVDGNTAPIWMKNELEEPSQQVAMQHMSDTQILYHAAGIIRSTMSNTEIADTGYYPLSEETNMNSLSRFIPYRVYDFVDWCVNNESYNKVKTHYGPDQDSCNLTTVSICHMLLASSQKIQSPLALSLGIRIYHDFGCKQLINDLHALGVCESYDNVRYFLTSVALDQKTADVFIPRGFERSDTGDGSNVQVDAAIDNFDQNEETLDGKSTTHSMAIVLYKRCPATNPSRIQKSRVKALAATDQIADPISR